jgi:hypothetical protein
MRAASALGILAISLLPAVVRADEPVESVKIGRLEEIGVVVAGVGGVGLLSGGILMAMGFDRQTTECRGITMCTVPLPPEVYVATAMMITGAVALGAGIPLAFIGKAKRHAREKKELEKQKPAAMIVPTFGGAVLSLTF